MYAILYIRRVEVPHQCARVCVYCFDTNKSNLNRDHTTIGIIMDGV